MDRDIEQLLIGQFKRIEAQRQRIQGFGRPIISREIDGVRYVLVGDQVLRWHEWKTFPDFLFDYLKILITPEWLKQQESDKDPNKHQLFTWHRMVVENQRKNWERRNEKGFYYATISGADKAFYRLAYDLYLCAHNSVLLQRLLDRLALKSEFEAACYEAYVAGILMQAGFEVEFEDESDNTRKHCEFTATYPASGAKFSIEAKAITSRSQHWGKDDQCPKVRRKLAEALQKEFRHTPVVFIDLGVPAKFDSAPPSWMSELNRNLLDTECSLLLGKQRPTPAFVFMTNRTYLHKLEHPEQNESFLSFGFRLPDFPSTPDKLRLLGMHRSRKVYPEMHFLLKFMQSRGGIPNTWDHRPAESVFGTETKPGAPENFDDPLDCFDFFWSTYSKSSRQDLLSWMNGWPEVQPHEAQSTEQLAEIFCSVHGERMWNENSRLPLQL